MHASNEYYGYRSAESEAQRLSLIDHSTPYFVNWANNNTWSVSTTQTLPQQPCWINGQMHYAGELLPAHAGLIHMTYDARIKPMGLCYA